MVLTVPQMRRLNGGPDSRRVPFPPPPSDSQSTIREGKCENVVFISLPILSCKLSALISNCCRTWLRSVLWAPYMHIINLGYYYYYFYYYLILLLFIWFISQLAGNEDPMDLWILSKLSDTVSKCESGWPAYDFPTITTAIFSFWLYSLCDVYLVRFKIIYIIISFVYFSFYMELLGSWIL